MKKILTLLIAIISISSIQAQEIDNRQWSFFVKKTANWCSKCGTYGWSFYKSVYDQYSDKNLVIMAAHSSGDLKTDVSAAVSNVVSASSHPKFIVDQKKLGVTSGNMSDKLNEVRDAVNSNANVQPAIGLGTSATLDAAGNLHVKNIAKLLKTNTQKDYSIANYLVRKKVQASQSGQSGTVEHINVLEASVSGNAFGKEISFSSLDTGTEAVVETTGKHSINPNDYLLYTVLWSKSNGEYVFYNATKSDIKTSSNVSDTDLSDRIEIIDANRSYMTLNIDSKMSNIVNLQIYTQTGKLVASADIVPSRDQRVEYGDLAGGVYYIRVTAGSHVCTKSVLIK